MAGNVDHSEQAIRFLIYLGGIASTLAGSWVASKIRIYHDNRKLHHDDLKQKVLIPLLSGLRDSYGPLVRGESPAISNEWGRQVLHEDARVTEHQEVLGPVLQTTDPRSSIEKGMDEALFTDARQNHYRQLISDWESFASGWSKHAQDCGMWVSRRAMEVLNRSGLPPHPGPTRGPYVMQLHLAVYIYLRLFGFRTAPLRKERFVEEWCLTSGSVNSATGSEQQIDYLISLLDGLMGTERPTVIALRGQSDRLAMTLSSLCGRLSLAIADRRLRGRCNIVGLL